MPKATRKRSIDPYALVGIVALQKADADALPRNQDLLRGCLSALLERARRRSMAQERLLRRHLRILAGLEQQMPQRLHDLAIPSLLSLAYAPPSKAKHWPEVLKLQWNTLLVYLREKDFNERAGWIEEHKSEIRKRLTSIPCNCRYRRDLANSIREVAERERKGKPTSLAFVATQILADVHSTGPENIRKWLRDRVDRGQADFAAWIIEKRRSEGWLEDYAKTVRLSIPYFSKVREKVTKTVLPSSGTVT